MFTKDKISYKDGMGRVPAMCNIHTGELYLNVDLWDKIPYTHQQFIILHESGHVALQTTTDEMACDAYASERYFALGLPLSESVYAISEHLLGRHDQDYQRVEAQAVRCRIFDESQKKKKMTESNIKLDMVRKPRIKTKDSFYKEEGIAAAFWDKYDIFTPQEIKKMDAGELRDAIIEAKEDIADYEEDLKDAISDNDIGDIEEYKGKIKEIQDNIKLLQGEVQFREIAAGTGATDFNDLNSLDTSKFNTLMQANQNSKVLDYNKDMYGLQTGQNIWGATMYADKNKQQSYQEAMRNGINPYTSDSFTGQLVDGWKSTSDSFMRAFGGGGGYQNSQMQQNASVQQSNNTTYMIVGVVLVLAFLYFNKTKKKV